MQNTREPAVAGMFYPDNANELSRIVDGLLEENTVPDTVPKAIIAPHAGYVYSGPIAASAYRCLLSARDRIHRVVLLGPSHRVYFQGLAVSNATEFRTPLGTVKVDQDAVAQVRTLPQVKVLDEAHTLEHSLEVHLPFLQRVLADFQIVPLVVGEASAREVSETLEALWGDSETVIVVSSDLSHYHDYATAQRMDAATSHAIEALKPDDIDTEQACGRVPIIGLLEAAKSHGLKARTLDLRSSGDTAGPRDQVVGYGAYIFS